MVVQFEKASSLIIEYGTSKFLRIEYYTDTLYANFCRTLMSIT